jgi:hypothetical protein
MISFKAQEIPILPTKEEIEKERAMHIVSLSFMGEECADCKLIERGKKAPSFAGSSMCKSGSIASGGKYPHCECPICWG